MLCLSILKTRNCQNWPNIKKGICQLVLQQGKRAIPSDEEIAHAFYLLERDGSVEKIERGHDGQIWYKLTPWGHARLGTWYQKTWFFVFNKKDHNLIAIIALIISVVALFV